MIRDEDIPPFRTRGDISVVIPTFKNVQMLDKCLYSAITGQQFVNEIIVVVDGKPDIPNHGKSIYSIMDEYSKYGVDFLEIENNLGTCMATNYGVYNSSYEKILIVNDDNIFPHDWDTITNYIPENSVLSVNQIEPIPSVFKQFVLKDFGRNADEFKYNEFVEYEKSIRVDKIENSGNTFPFFVNKKDFLRVGGFDANYPSMAGHVADWDFFLKCELSGLNMLRTYNRHFYHFVSATSSEESKEHEVKCHQYFKYKWGEFANSDRETNSKMLKKYKQ
ncbi:putative glycosyltransferases [Microcystis phage Mel-JY01]